MFLQLLGICFPHDFSQGWFVYDNYLYKRNGGWRSPRPGEQAQSSCAHCNHRIYKVWK